MAYLTDKQLKAIGFKHLGKNVQISDKASIYNTNEIILHDHCRIDDFCLLSGKISIGSYVHITPYCLLAGGIPGITLEDFTTLAYGVYIFTQSDDYSGETMVNSLVPAEYKREIKQPVIIQSHSIIGARSTVFPGVKLSQGTSVGAMSLVLKDTNPWGVYAGIPAKRIKDRSMNMLKHHQKFIDSDQFKNIN